MKKAARIVLLGGIFCLILPSAPAAANRKAQKMVADTMEQQVALLAKFPALGLIDNALRSECAAQNQGRIATGAFCGCASAITVSLWRSGVDPNMIPRINDFLRAPTEAGAATFLRFQGPELYRPICTEAEKH
jgi:hypothetical protein